MDAMCGGLKGINKDNRKYDTSLNSFKGHPSLEESCNPDSLISLVGDNAVSEFKNEIVTETDESYLSF